MALRDPVAVVRRHAVHGLKCERCRAGDLCVADLVPAVVDAFAAERDAATRHQLVVVLGQFRVTERAARETLDDGAPNCAAISTGMR